MFDEEPLDALLFDDERYKLYRIVVNAVVTVVGSMSRASNLSRVFLTQTVMVPTMITVLSLYRSIQAQVISVVTVAKSISLKRAVQATVTVIAQFKRQVVFVRAFAGKIVITGTMSRLTTRFRKFIGVCTVKVWVLWRDIIPREVIRLNSYITKAIDLSSVVTRVKQFVSKLNQE